MNKQAGLIQTLLPLIFLTIVVLATSQDYLAAQILGQGFYLSESLLFKFIWLLFIPALLLLLPFVSRGLSVPAKVYYTYFQFPLV